VQRLQYRYSHGAYSRSRRTLAASAAPADAKMKGVAEYIAAIAARNIPIAKKNHL
jgi:hypothetical protein